MKFGAFSTIVTLAALAVTYGESLGSPVRLLLARVEQAQGTEEILKAAQARQTMIRRQLRFATATDSSTALRERQLRHEEDSAGHADQMISDMQNMLTDERELRMASQAKASKVQQTLRNATDDEARLSSELQQAQEAALQHAQELTTATTALVRADLDKKSLLQKLDVVTKADAQKATIIIKDVNIEEILKEKEKTNTGLLQQKLDQEKVVEKQHEQVEKEDKATIGRLIAKSNSLFQNVDALHVEISKQSQALLNSENAAQTQRDLAAETKKELAKANAQIAPFEEMKAKYANAQNADNILKAKYDTQVDASIQARKLEQKEESILLSTQDTLKHTTLMLREQLKAKKEEDLEVQQMTLEDHRKNADLQKQAVRLEAQKAQKTQTDMKVKIMEKETKTKMEATQQQLKEASAQITALKKKADQSRDNAYELSDQSKNLRAKLTVLQDSDKSQKSKLKAMLSKMTQQDKRADENEVEFRAIAKKTELTLKRQVADTKAKLDASTEKRLEIQAKEVEDKGAVKLQADLKILKLQAAESQAELKGATEASRLKAIIDDDKKKINTLEVDQSKHNAMEKAASEEKAKLAAGVKSYAKDLAAKTKELQSTRLQGDTLTQKLKKVSTALVKEHKQRLDDWKVFKNKMDAGA